MRDSPLSSARTLHAALLMVTGCLVLFAVGTDSQPSQKVATAGPSTFGGFAAQTAAQAAPPPTAQLNFPTQGPRPGTLRLVPAFPNIGSFSRPVFLTHAGDGTNRIFIMQQAGQILVFPNNPAQTTRTTFLNIQSRVLAPGSGGGNEEGLLGLTFHPQYETNGFFYVYYSAANPRRSVIARYRVSSGDPNVADPASESILMTIGQPYSNHNGGWMDFGPDGKLYIGTGDGGSGGDPQGYGQNTNTLLGKFLRIDVDTTTGALNYGIPADNPFVGRAGYREEIWALGMRNPWRNSFDRQTGELWSGDVGQTAREEIDLIVRGGNYGWNVFEGNIVYRNPNNLPPSLFVFPIVDYVRSLATSITGGYVYRGNRFPEMRGLYLHGDYGTGNIWSLQARNGVLISNTRAATGSSVASFGEDESGEVYSISLSGVIHRIEPTTPGGGQFPQTLSATGLFSDLATLTPAPGVLPYEINHPYWADHASMKRWISWPGSAYTFHPTDPYQFPVGTVLTKHMEIEMIVGNPASAKRLETRVLVHEAEGWFGYTYRWNQAGTEAVLTNGREFESLTIRDQANNVVRIQNWTYPSRTDCMQCHTAADGRVLGFRTRQLNRTVGNPPVNQLEDFDGQQMFTTTIGQAHQYGAYPNLADTAAPVADRARAYLAVNCANCHLPGGTAPGNADLRYGIPESQMNIFDVRPTQGDLGLNDAYVVKTQVRQSSVLHERMLRTDSTRMSPIGSSQVDALGVSVIGAWIGSPFEPFGTGCASSSGVPELSVQGEQWPRIGNTFGIFTSNVPQAEVAALALGFSRTVFNGLPLPADLSVIGMTGCSLLISPDLFFGSTGTATGAITTLPLPNDPSLLGVKFYHQALVTSLGINPLGAVVSNGAEMTVVR